MKPFDQVTGIVAPLNRVNVDTDQIIPKQFLKRIERTGFGPFLFYDWRYMPDGKTPDTTFTLNTPAYRDATILLAGRNFGCGSSREHAPWALADYGFRVIIAPSFADIFYNNCFKNGILLIKLSEEIIANLMRRAEKANGYSITVNLETQEILDLEGLSIYFDIDGFRKICMLKGLDDISLTLEHEADITRFENNRPAWMKGIRAESG